MASRKPKMITDCTLCSREIGVLPAFDWPGQFKVAPHPPCTGGGILVRADAVRPNPAVPAAPASEKMVTYVIARKEEVR